MNSNEELIKLLLDRGYADKRIAEAMRKADRKAFVPANYWPDAYEDHPLPIGFGQTISAPGVVAFMSKSLDVKEGHRVLEIGAGSGWQAAILGLLVGKKGHVASIERVPELAVRANENLKKVGLGNAVVVQGDGTLGCPEKAPFDRIIVTAAGPQIPPPLLEQLADGGKLIMPTGGSFAQELVLATKRKGKIDIKPIMSVIFVPLIGKFGYRE